MLNLDNPITFTNEELIYLNSLVNPSKLESSSWTEYNDDIEMKAIKTNMKDRSLLLQGSQCVYCRRMIDTRTKYDGDREHFANKDRYPEFTYEAYNLFLSCITCNRPLKGRRDIIDVYNNNYINCTFKIVHPILDNVDQHIYYIEQTMPQKITPKGEETIKLFQLDSPMLIRENEKELRQSDYENLPNDIMELIDAVGDFRQ